MQTVLLAGIGMSKEAWDPMLPRLRAGGIEPVPVDNPGFGARPEPPGGSTIPNQVEALIGVLDELGLERPHLIGCSMGGWLSLELARRGRAGRLVLLSPAGSGDERERASGDRILRMFRWGARQPLPEGLVRVPAVRYLTALAMVAHANRADPDDLLVQNRSVGESPGWDAAREYLRRNTIERPGEIGAPALIVRGRSDRVIGSAQVKRLAAELPDAALVELPGVGHLPMFDDPDLVAGIAAEFLASGD